ncbi:MAG: hypothetical protein EBU07_19320 [Betaproteobacteria bacterium]|nr:hypothetical protein [Betaproteobacteria bacterium]
MGRLMVNSVPLHAGQSDIWTDITVDVLTLDDAVSNGGNNNIGDGSPNYARIAQGFGNHSLTAPPLNLLTITVGTIPNPVNPAGFTIHSAIHMAREDARAVMHLHTDDGVAVSAMAQGLMPITQTAMVIADQVAYHEYEGVALDLGERERLVADLGAKKLMLLRNHGTLAVGATVSDCFLMLYTFERACSMQVRALVSGALHLPSAASVETSRQQGSKLMASGQLDRLAWPALLRMLDRKDPGFRS